MVRQGNVQKSVSEETIAVTFRERLGLGEGIQETL